MVVDGRVRWDWRRERALTIGHWTCPREVFLSPLLREGIELVIDVRAQPGSRRSPQFGRDELPGWLSEAGIAYVHLYELGGRRPKQPVDADINGGWKNASFHNYADYTLSDDYRAGVERLEALAREKRVVLLCGEPMPWRCHRSLIANTMTARGWTVWHLIGDAPPRRHELGAWGPTPLLDADGRLTDPALLGSAHLSRSKEE